MLQRVSLKKVCRAKTYLPEISEINALKHYSPFVLCQFHSQLFSARNISCASIAFPKIDGSWNSVAATLSEIFLECILKEKSNHLKSLVVASEVALAERSIRIDRWQYTVQADIDSWNHLLDRVRHENCFVRGPKARF